MTDGTFSERPPIAKSIRDAQDATALSLQEPKEENPLSKQPKELEALQNRLQSRMGPDTKEETQPENLSTIQWHMMGDRPSDIPPNTIATKKITTPFITRQEELKARQEQLQQEADKCLVARPNLKAIINRVSLFNQMGALAVRDWTKKPEELSAAIIIFNNYGIGSSYEGEQNISRAIGVAFRALRTDVEGGIYSDTKASWATIDGTPRYDNVAGVIYNNLKAQVTEIHQLDFDACVMSALACGDPMTALRLIQMADKFLPEQGNEASANALSRLADSNSSFDKAYDIYPLTIKAKMDGLLASLGEGQLQDLGQLPRAQELKKQAEERLKQRLITLRNNWYLSQKVVPTEIREQQLDSFHLQQEIDQLTQAGEGAADIEKIIEERAGRVVDGQIANLIAAELSRRMQPELSIEEQIRLEKAKAMREVDRPTPHFHETNIYEEEMFGYGQDGLQSDLSTSEKEKRIQAIYSPDERKLTEKLFAVQKIGFSDVVTFLRNPGTYAYYVDKAIKEYRGDSQQKLMEGRRALARKLIVSINYLQALSNNPETKKVLQQEFGLSYLVDGQNLEKATEELRNLFSEVVDQDTNQTLYEQMLEESQYDEDTRVAAQIAFVRPREVARLTEDKLTETVDLVDDISQASELRMRLAARKGKKS